MKDLAKFCIRHMMSKDVVREFFEINNLKFSASFSYEKLANFYDDKAPLDFRIDSVRNFLRHKWNSENIAFHLRNLQSEKLTGHSWHNAAPSRLHLSFQDKVRNFINDKSDLEQLIQIGSDVMKHEYFMVAAHDLCESTIIAQFEDTIPPLRAKSIADFVFKGIPYDLKNTNYFRGWDKNSANKNPKKLAVELFEGADPQRLRKQAQKSLNGWGLNRFYVLVENQERWLKEPQGILNELTEKCKTLGKPTEYQFGEFQIYLQLVAL